jgi:hypothetical protein
MNGTSLRLAALGGVLIALAATPPDLVASLPIVCIWRRLFDIECFGCGMTRALALALHGDLAAAMAFNRGVVLLLPATVATMIWDLCAICSRDASQDHPSRPERSTSLVWHP